MTPECEHTHTHKDDDGKQSGGKGHSAAFAAVRPQGRNFFPPQRRKYFDAVMIGQPKSFPTRRVQRFAVHQRPDRRFSRLRNRPLKVRMSEANAAKPLQRKGKTESPPVTDDFTCPPPSYQARRIADDCLVFIIDFLHYTCPEGSLQSAHPPEKFRRRRAHGGGDGNFQSTVTRDDN